MINLHLKPITEFHEQLKLPNQDYSIIQQCYNNSNEPNNVEHLGAPYLLSLFLLDADDECWAQLQEFIE